MFFFVSESHNTIFFDTRQIKAGKVFLMLLINIQGTYKNISCDIHILSKVLTDFLT